MSSIFWRTLRRNVFREKTQRLKRYTASLHQPHLDAALTANMAMKRCWMSLKSSSAPAPKCCFSALMLAASFRAIFSSSLTRDSLISRDAQCPAQSQFFFPWERPHPQRAELIWGRSPATAALNKEFSCQKPNGPKWLHACMHACMHVCMYVWMYVWMYVCMYVWMYVWMYVCMYVCMYMYVCVKRSSALSSRSFFRLATSCRRREAAQGGGTWNNTVM